MADLRDHPPKKKKLIACRSVAHLLAPLADDVETRLMEIGLHVDPARLKAALREVIGEVEEEGAVILLGYGLCGRGTEGLVSRLSTLILPRVDDCVGALLGGRANHRAFLAAHPGTYFGEPRWLGTQMDLFSQFGAERLKVSEERRERLMKAALRNYRTLGVFSAGEGEGARETYRGYAARYGLDYLEIEPSTGILERLVKGPWGADEFVVAGPGEPIELF